MSIDTTTPDTTTITPDTIRAYRQQAGLSIAQAARQLANTSPDTLPPVDSLTRAWKRWEAGSKPSRAYQALLRGLLAATSPAPTAVDLSGEWWATWQTYRNSIERFDTHTIGIQQRGIDIKWWSATRAVPVAEGGYLWSGEARLWDNETLMGWYTADDGSVRSKGTAYLHLHPHGQTMTGRWVGLSHDGPIITGLAAIARTRDASEATMRDLAGQHHPGA